MNSTFLRLFFVCCDVVIYKTGKIETFPHLIHQTWWYKLTLSVYYLYKHFAGNVNWSRISRCFCLAHGKILSSITITKKLRHLQCGGVWNKQKSCSEDHYKKATELSHKLAKMLVIRFVWRKKNPEKRECMFCSN